MSNFGFGPGNPNEDENGAPDFSQFFSQFAQFGINPQALFTAAAGNGPLVSRDTIREIARNFIAAQSEIAVGSVDLAQSQEAIDIANIWLDEATVFPALTRGVQSAWSRREWLEASLDGWQKLVEPLAQGMATALTNILSESGVENAPEMAAVTPIMRAFMGSLIASQLGQSVGQLAISVTGSNDLALPLFSPQVDPSSQIGFAPTSHERVQPHLLPQNILSWSEGLEIPEEEIRIYLALREAAAARLFANTPWLGDYINSLISEYGKGIRIDIQTIQNQAESAMNTGELDINNPQSISVAINQGMFTPEQTPKQEAALHKLEMALALIEGWIDHVTSLAGGNRLPSFAALHETSRRKRATAAPTQQLFKTLLGLEISPRQMRECATFWSEVNELEGLAERDHRWENEALLPKSADLANVEKFIASTTVPDDLSALFDFGSDGDAGSGGSDGDAGENGPTSQK